MSTGKVSEHAGNLVSCGKRWPADRQHSKTGDFSDNPMLDCQNNYCFYCYYNAGVKKKIKCVIIDLLYKKENIKKHMMIV